MLKLLTPAELRSGNCATTARVSGVSHYKEAIMPSYSESRESRY